MPPVSKKNKDSKKKSDSDSESDAELVDGDAKESGAKLPTALPQPPPLPSAPPAASKQETFSSISLVEIPCSFLYDRSGWPAFKRALNECGLTWNLPDWMTTIVYKGTEWKAIAAKGTDLDTYFPVVEKTKAGDGASSKSSKLGLKLTHLLGLPTNMGESIRPSVQFCCLSTVEFEDERRLPARQKLWTWIVKSLRGNKATIGPFHYLIDEVQMYDIALLFKRLVEVLEQITICSLDDELELVIKMDYNPQKQNVFSYLGDLRKAVKRLHELGERLPESGRIILPDSYIRSRLVRAARQVPVYKPVIDALLIQPMEKWAVITSDEIYHQLEAVCANEISVTVSNNYGATDGLQANTAYVKQPNAQAIKKKPVCFNFVKGAPCRNNPCNFSHDSPEQKSVKASSSNSAHASPLKCNTCGEAHLTKQCKKNITCSWCGKHGHLEQVCRSKQKNVPKAFSASEGSQLRSNMVIVNSPSDSFALTVSCSPPPPTRVCD